MISLNSYTFVVNDFKNQNGNEKQSEKKAYKELQKQKMIYDKGSNHRLSAHCTFLLFNTYIYVLIRKPNSEKMSMKIS